MRFQAYPQYCLTMITTAFSDGLLFCQEFFHRFNAKTPMKWEVISLFMGVAVKIPISKIVDIARTY